MPQLGHAESVDSRIYEGVAHHQHHMQLEQGPVAFTVRIHRANCDDDQVDKKRRPTHHKRPEQDGESQSASHVAAPPPLMMRLVPAATRQRGDVLSVNAGHHEHVDVEEADGCQGDDEEDDEADDDELKVEELHH